MYLFLFVPQVSRTHGLVEARGPRLTVSDRRFPDCAHACAQRGGIKCNAPAPDPTPPPPSLPPPPPMMLGNMPLTSSPKNQGVGGLGWKGGGRPGQHAKGWSNWPHALGNAARHVVNEGSGQQRPRNDPRNNQHNPQCADCCAPLTQKRHQQEHRPQRPTESSDPTQHAKGRTGDCPGPRKETVTRRNVTRGACSPPPPPQSTARATARLWDSRPRSSQTGQVIQRLR